MRQRGTLKALHKLALPLSPVQADSNKILNVPDCLPLSFGVKLDWIWSTATECLLTQQTVPHVHVADSADCTSCKCMAISMSYSDIKVVKDIVI